MKPSYPKRDFKKKIGKCKCNGGPASGNVFKRTVAGRPKEILFSVLRLTAPESPLSYKQSMPYR